MSDLTQRLNQLTTSRIGIIEPTSLGGVVRTLPLFPALNERFPGAELVAIATSDNAELLEGHRRIARVISYRRREFFAQWRPLLKVIQATDFDLVIDLKGLLRTGLMSLATGAPVRLGLETAREGSALACTHLVRDSGPLVPDYLRYWRVAEMLGVGDLRQVSEVPIDDRAANWAADQAASVRRPLLSVHPGASWQTKRWPVEKFAVVACKAMRQHKCGVAILGADADIPAAEHFASLMKKFVPSKTVLNLAGKTSLKRLAAFLRESDCLLTNDSGPMHLAASLGTPVTGLFTCTSPVISGPPGATNELISTCVDCRARYRKRCPMRGARHLACMDELSIERVTSAVSAVLLRRRSIGRAA